MNNRQTTTKSTSNPVSQSYHASPIRHPNLVLTRVLETVNGKKRIFPEIALTTNSTCLIERSDEYTGFYIFLMRIYFTPTTCCQNTLSSAETSVARFPTKAKIGKAWRLSGVLSASNSITYSKKKLLRRPPKPVGQLVLRVFATTMFSCSAITIQKNPLLGSPPIR